MKVSQFVAAALVVTPCAAFFAPVGSSSFAARQRAAMRQSSVTSVRMGEPSSDVAEKVIDIVGEQLEKQGSVKIESNFIDDLDADSLDTVEIIMALEEEFGIDISEDEAQKMTSVQDAVTYISENL